MQPGRDKRKFLIFDYCQNFEFFNQNPDLKEGPQGLSLTAKLFVARLELTSLLSELGEGKGSEGLTQLDKDLRSRLFDQVSAINLDSFLVHAKRWDVQTFQQIAAWTGLGPAERETLINEIAGFRPPPQANTNRCVSLEGVIKMFKNALTGRSPDDAARSRVFLSKIHEIRLSQQATL